MGWVNLSDLVTESLQANPLPVSAGGTGINNMADVIVDQGTSGEWNYVKYASGKAECWANVTVSVTAFSAWGGIYEGTRMDAKSYPFTWVETPGFIAMLRSASNGMYIAGFEYGPSGSATTTPTVHVLRGSNWTSGSTLQIMIYAIGRWK